MEPEPKASRPRMDGYGVPQEPKGTLPWEWARDRLSSSHNYWLTTVGRSGVPHTMPVWRVWLDGAWYFSTATTSRKARNIAQNPHCVVCNDKAEEAVILEGVVGLLANAEIPLSVAVAYKAKYGWELQGNVFKVQPRVAFAMPEEQFPANVTGWAFA